MSAVGSIDLDGRVSPAVELIYERGTPAFRGQWLDIERGLFLVGPRPDAGDWIAPYLSLEHDRSVRERLPEHVSETVEAGLLQDNAAGRLRALDAAGVEVQLLNPERSVDASFELATNLGVGLLAAYNRYVTTYCEADPARLRATLQVHGGDPQWSAEEIEELGADPAVAAVSVSFPANVVPDSPRFAPIWEALEGAGLPLLFRPTIAIPAWTPARFVNYLMMSGIFDRYPRLRLAIAESGRRWLAPWLAGEDVPGSTAAQRAELLGRRLFVLCGPGDQGEGADLLRALDEHDRAGAMLWGSRFPICHGPAGELLLPGAGATDGDGPLVSNPRRFLAGTEPAG
jgi:hypothetical protein